MTRSPRSLTQLAAAAALAAASLVGSAHAGVIINYNSFAAADCQPGGGLNCVGSTGVVGNALRLTPAAAGQAGAGYSKTAATLGANSTFSTSFQFRITNTGGISPADGLTFVVAKSDTGLGSSGGGIGYGGVNNSLAIEFDTYFNGGLDPNGNHVGVNVNGGLTSGATATPYGVTNCSAVGNTNQGCMSNGRIWTAFISYDGTSNLLSVALQESGSVLTNLISTTSYDLDAILGSPTAFVGFTSGTGSGWGNHDILNWRFANDTSITNNVPEPMSLALVGMALAAAGVASRKRAASR